MYLAAMLPLFILSLFGCSVYTFRVKASSRAVDPSPYSGAVCGFLTTRQVVSRSERAAQQKVRDRIVKDREVIAFFADHGVAVPDLQCELLQGPFRSSRSMRSGYTFYREQADVRA